MRRALTCTTSLVALFASIALASLASGCTLYFGGEQPYDDVYYPPDARPDYPDSGPHEPIPASYGFARCEDGTIRHVQLPSLPAGDMPGHGAGTLAGTCPQGCRSAVAQCASPYDCAQADQTVCNAPVATGPRSTYQGQTCSASSVTYTNTNACGQVFPGGTCSCDSSGHYACSAASDTAAVHASLVGKWRGTVTPPDFASPYQITLWIYPDGTYWSDCASSSCYTAFYYGGDGPHPWRRINVLSTTDQLGATADIGMFYDHNIGALTSLFVTNTTLSFTLYAAWFGCSQPFNVSLTRE